MRYKPTKKDKARVIFQALYNLDELPKEEGIWLKRINSKARLSLNIIDWEYNQALKVLNERVKRTLTA